MANKEEILFKSLLRSPLAFTFLMCCFQVYSQDLPISDKGLIPNDLTLEYLKNPLGIDVILPRLSWNSLSNERGAFQASYRVLVASTVEKLEGDEGDLWDTDKVESDKSLNIRYGGRELGSGAIYYWKVKLWDGEGNESGWSEKAKFSMGLLDPSDWLGDWIGMEKEIGEDKLDTTFTRMSARYLRKEVELIKKVKRATAYVAGLGLFELYVNEKKVGDAVLSPALAEYPKRAWYMSFDISDQLREGKNAIGVILGNGRYVGMRNQEIEIYYDKSKLSHYGFPKMIAQIEIEYEDGTIKTVISDKSWKLTANGPITANNEFDGEEYDANKELLGWNGISYDDSEWLQAEITNPGAAKLSAQMTPPIKIIENVKPVSVKEIAQDTFIVDMGQNLVGWVRLKVKGQKGDRISLRFAERLNSDGSLYLDPIRTAKVNDIYTLKGKSEEVWEPRFTYHGFQFVEITGYPREPDLNSITGRVVYDELKPIGEFTSSNSIINKIYQNARWSIKGNYRSIPTDCPQRDERQGWLGDRATGSRGESYLFKNAPFYSKWLQDIDDAQNSAGSIPDVAPTYWSIYSDNMTWPAAYIIIADMLFDQFGDEESIRKHYPSMKKWLAYMLENYMNDYIINKDTYGDWGVPPKSRSLIHSQDAKSKTSPAVLGTSYSYHLLELMEEFAVLIGEDQDAQEFAELKEKVKEAFNRNFFDTKLRAYKNNTATTNVLALHFGLVPEEYKEDIFQNLVDVTKNDFNGHISVGLIGVQALMRIFTDNGRPEIAYKLATNISYPSWGYMVEQGATTIWELWNSDTADPFMNSWNHVMLLGDLIIWYYEDLAGIKPDPTVPAFKKILMKPTPVGDLTHIKASHSSPYGLIKSEWRVQDGDFHWKIEIPANTTATLYFPTAIEEKVLEGNMPIAKAKRISFLGIEKNRIIFEVESGKYSFMVTDFFKNYF